MTEHRSLRFLRGCMNQQHTWPDVGAPGRDIWATAPRGTAIDASTRTQGDLYYMAISGRPWQPLTLVAWLESFSISLHLWELQIIIEKITMKAIASSAVKAAAYGQFEDWDTANYSRVHELELISN